MAVWLRELTEFRWTGSGSRSVQWQGVAYWLVATGYSCHGIQVLCETSHWTTVCNLCRCGPVVLCARTLYACLRHITAHVSYMLRYLKQLQKGPLLGTSYHRHPHVTPELLEIVGMCANIHLMFTSEKLIPHYTDRHMGSHASQPKNHMTNRLRLVTWLSQSSTDLERAIVVNR